MTKLLFENVRGRWRCGSDYPEVRVTRITGPDGIVAFAYVSNVQVDFDGAPDAYGPPGTRHREPIDNARIIPGSTEKKWYGVVALTPEEAKAEAKNPKAKRITPKLDLRPDMKDRRGKFPVLQQAPGEPNPGFYVSQGSIVANDAFPKWDQRHWVDATRVAFGAISTPLKKEGFALLDFCLSIRPAKGLQAVYPFMDSSGHAHKLGEISYRAYADLGGVGFTDKDVQRGNGFLCCHMAFANSSGSSVETVLARLSTADNPGDLPLMLACQFAVKPKGDGLALLQTYQNANAQERLRKPLPHDFHAVVAGLRSAGYHYMEPGGFPNLLLGRA